MSSHLRILMFVAAAVVYLASSMSAFAGTLTISLDSVFSGGGPSGPAPWLVAHFDDGGTPGSVDITLTATNLTGSEYVSGWYINLDPVFDATQLVFSSPIKVGAFDDPSISLGTDQFQADGDGRYDVLFSFSSSGQGGGVRRFGVGEELSYTMTGIAGMTAQSFDFMSFDVGGHGPFLAAAHVHGAGNGWIAPEVIAMPLPQAAGMGVISLVILFGLRATGSKR